MICGGLLVVKSEQRNLSIDDFLALSGVPNTGSGEYVSAGTAESLPAVMNAVSVIAEAVATMPCYLYLVRNDKGRRRGNGWTVTR